MNYNILNLNGEFTVKGIKIAMFHTEVLEHFSQKGLKLFLFIFENGVLKDKALQLLRKCGYPERGMLVVVWLEGTNRGRQGWTYNS